MTFLEFSGLWDDHNGKVTLTFIGDPGDTLDIYFLTANNVVEGSLVFPGANTLYQNPHLAISVASAPPVGVPEPGTLALLCFGLLALGLLKWKRRGAALLPLLAFTGHARAPTISDGQTTLFGFSGPLTFVGPAASPPGALLTWCSRVT